LELCQCNDLLPFLNNIKSSTNFVPELSIEYTCLALTLHFFLLKKAFLILFKNPSRCLDVFHVLKSPKDEAKAGEATREAAKATVIGTQPNVQRHTLVTPTGSSLIITAGNAAK